MNPSFPERRQFLKQAASIALSWCGCLERGDAAPGLLPNPVGYATIAWPENEFTGALETISSLGFKGVQMLGWVRDAYAGPKLETLREQLNRLKLQPVTLSCSKLVLEPAKPVDESDNFRAYGSFFQRLGGHYLQISDGGQPERKYSGEAINALATRMNTLGKIAQDFGLMLGYHPHFGTIGETREGLGRILEATDPRYVKLIADVAHLTLGGADPAEVIRTYHERLIHTHFKDVRKDVAMLARKNRALARRKKYRFCEIGDGVVNFRGVLQAFREVNFRGWIIVELDGYELPPGGPAESARKNMRAAQTLGLNV